MMDLLEIARNVAIFFIPFLFSLCFHEFAHGWVAKLRGDPTAERMGRLTLNPAAHADLVGTYILPIASIVFSLPIFFGWAKPVPVDSRYLKSPRTDLFWIALAGPLSNILLAFLGSFAIALVAVQFASAGAKPALIEILRVFITMNLFLAFFNLIPIRPLDGGAVLARFLPPEWNQKIEEHEALLSWLLLALVVSGALKILAVPVLWTAQFMVRVALALVG
ncbi:MAG: site-2 protease family protein [Bdellovibrio sp.]